MKKEELDKLNPLEIIALIQGGITWLLTNIATAKPLIGWRKETRAEIDKLKELVALQGKAIVDLQEKM